MSLNVEKLRNPEIKLWANDHLDGLARLVALGAPVLADVDRIVVSANMKVGKYTIAAQPDVARNITVSATAVGTADTPGTITVVGTNYAGEAISEVITPIAGSIVAGTKAFKTVVSVTGAGWVVDETEETADTITVGVGTVLGLPYKLAVSTEVLLGVLGTAIIAPTVVAAGTLEGSTVDISSGTYDGTKKAFVFVVE